MTICTPTKKARIWTLHKQGRSAAQISKVVPVHPTTVRAVIRKLRVNCNFYAGNMKSGRPRKLTPRDLRHASQILVRGDARDATDLQRKEFPQVSARTMRHNLCEIGLYGYIRRRKPYLSASHKAKRLLWAEFTAKWPHSYWQHIIFSDESKFNLFGSDGRQYCRRRPGEELQDQYVHKRVKHGGGSLMVWGCITEKGPGRLHRVEGRMTGAQYISILSESLMGTLQDHQIPGRCAIFQQDNDPKHTCKVAQAWLRDNSIMVLPWPASSPDMNIIEHVWDRVDRQLRARKKQPSNLGELWDALQEEWAGLDVGWIQELYRSLPRRTALLLEAKGGYTKY